MLKIGSIAPQFTLKDAEGKAFSLEDFKGKKVVLYFYSKDNTGGCTTQALGFKERYEEIAKQNAVVIGISKDGAASHKRFIEKYELPFLLLCNEDLSVIKTYEAWGEKKLYGNTTYGVIRTTYLIDENGVIISAETKVKAANDPENVLNKLLCSC